MRFFGDDVYKEVWGFLNVDKIDEALDFLRNVKSDMETFMKLAESKELPEGERFKLFQKREKTWLERRHKQLESLLTYIGNNSDCINGAKALVPLGFPTEAFVFGSGPAEKLQGTLFGYRMKKQGKSWGRDGAFHMSGLLHHYYNGEECAALLEELSTGYREWEATNERLEKGGVCVGEGSCDSKTKYSELFRVGLPIISRGKKDTVMFDFLRSISDCNWLFATG